MVLVDLGVFSCVPDVEATTTLGVVLLSLLERPSARSRNLARNGMFRCSWKFYHEHEAVLRCW